jgi:hypothetical protein
MDGTGQESYPMVAFVIGSVESLGSITRELVEKLLLANEISMLKGNINTIKKTKINQNMCV